MYNVVVGSHHTFSWTYGQCSGPLEHTPIYSRGWEHRCSTNPLARNPSELMDLSQGVHSAPPAKISSQLKGLPATGSHGAPLL